jgi:hypothetical protein
LQAHRRLPGRVCRFGRVIRDIRRKIAGDDALTARFDPLP